jgi:hypothetical protein
VTGIAGSAKRSGRRRKKRREQPNDSVTKDGLVRGLQTKLRLCMVFTRTRTASRLRADPIRRLGLLTARQ